MRACVHVQGEIIKQVSDALFEIKYRDDDREHAPAWVFKRWLVPLEKCTCMCMSCYNKYTPEYLQKYHTKISKRCRTDDDVPLAVRRSVLKAAAHPDPPPVVIPPRARSNADDETQDEEVQRRCATSDKAGERDERERAQLSTEDLAAWTDLHLCLMGKRGKNKAFKCRYCHKDWVKTARRIRIEHFDASVCEGLEAYSSAEARRLQGGHHSAMSGGTAAIEKTLEASKAGADARRTNAIAGHELLQDPRHSRWTSRCWDCKKNCHRSREHCRGELGHTDPDWRDDPREKERAGKDEGKIEKEGARDEERKRQQEGPDQQKQPPAAGAVPPDSAAPLGEDTVCPLCGKDFSQAHPNARQVSH